MFFACNENTPKKILGLRPSGVFTRHWWLSSANTFLRGKKQHFWAKQIQFFTTMFSNTGDPCPWLSNGYFLRGENNICQGKKRCFKHQTLCYIAHLVPSTRLLGGKHNCTGGKLLELPNKNSKENFWQISTDTVYLRAVFGGEICFFGEDQTHCFCHTEKIWCV